MEQNNDRAEIRQVARLEAQFEALSQNVNRIESTVSAHLTKIENNWIVQFERLQATQQSNAAQARAEWSAVAKENLERTMQMFKEEQGRRNDEEKENKVARDRLTKIWVAASILIAILMSGDKLLKFFKALAN